MSAENGSKLMELPVQTETSENVPGSALVLHGASNSKPALPGNRPISPSSLKIANYVMANRPIASNEIDDPATLMGFLD